MCIQIMAASAQSISVIIAPARAWIAAAFPPISCHLQCCFRQLRQLFSLPRTTDGRKAGINNVLLSETGCSPPVSLKAEDRAVR